ncbi:hypothetical protein [Acinetobacter sp. NS4_7]
MRTDDEPDLLQAIFNEMQALKKAICSRDERRVGRSEFAERLNITERTLDYRIAEGVIKKPFKDGPKRYWLNSYVNEVITTRSTSDKVAA